MFRPSANVPLRSRGSPALETYRQWRAGKVRWSKPDPGQTSVVILHKTIPNVIDGRVTDPFSCRHLDSRLVTFQNRSFQILDLDTGHIETIDPRSVLRFHILD